MTPVAPQTITIYQRINRLLGNDLRVVRGPHLPHVDAKGYTVTVFPDARVARAAIGRSKHVVAEPRRVLDAINRIEPLAPVVCNMIDPTSDLPAYGVSGRRYKRGTRVAIINQANNGRFYLEGYATINGRRRESDMYAVIFEGECEESSRFIEDQAQSAPEAYVAELNSRVGL